MPRALWLLLRVESAATASLLDRNRRWKGNCFSRCGSYLDKQISFSFVSGAQLRIATISALALPSAAPHPNLEQTRSIFGHCASERGTPTRPSERGPDGQREMTAGVTPSDARCIAQCVTFELNLPLKHVQPYRCRNIIYAPSQKLMRVNCVLNANQGLLLRLIAIGYGSSVPRNKRMQILWELANSSLRLNSILIRRVPTLRMTFRSSPQFKFYGPLNYSLIPICYSRLFECSKIKKVAIRFISIFYFLIECVYMDERNINTWEYNLEQSLRSNHQT